jgi:hypothetical protein
MLERQPIRGFVGKALAGLVDVLPVASGMSRPLLIFSERRLRVES